jgi:tRNA-modifying protein YgfZ
MKPWFEFLRSQGASFDGEDILHFGNQTQEISDVSNKNVITPINDLGLIEVTGKDAVNFLQGQLTNDLKQLDGVHAQLSGYCTPKGRLLAILTVFAHYDHLHFILPKQRLNPIVERLSKYVMRADVKFNDFTPKIECIGLAGHEAPDIIDKVFNTRLDDSMAIKTLTESVIIRLPGSLPRFYILTLCEDTQWVWDSLSTYCNKVGRPAWELLHIEAGIPEIFDATQECFVPQMVNLDSLDGISFKKGCYTGQEIVARTHYLGKVKRRMYKASIMNQTLPKPGDMVYVGDTEEVAGQIVRSAPFTGGQTKVLVELRMETLNEPTVSLQWQGHQLHIEELPYLVA